MNEKARELILFIFMIAGTIVGRTKLQKIMYLLQRENGINIHLDFKTYLYGPFSRQLNEEVDILVKEGDIIPKAGITNSNTIYYQFTISEKGKNEAKKLWNKKPDDIKNKIIEHVSKFSHMTPTQIVKYVYETYPDAKPPEDL